MPLVDKYKPEKFADLIGRDAVIEDIKKKISSPEGIPHLMFYGPPGSGKTSISHVIANEIYGDKKKMFFHELNASNDRGVEAIREKVIELCNIKPMGFPYKIILMDEADNITPEAQAIMKRVIEKYSNTVRFIFTCNNVYKLISPILSRFVKYEFSTMDLKTLAVHLKKIVNKECLSFDDKALIQIARKSNSDIRSAINSLEKTTVVSDDVWDTMTYHKLVGMDRMERIKLAFSADPDTIFSRVWEMVQEAQAWENLDLMASTQASMNYAAIKSVFIAKMMEGLK